MASLIVALPAGSARSAPKKKRCTAAGAKTVAKNRFARVFESPGFNDHQDKRLFGCLYRRNVRIPLDIAGDNGDYRDSFEFVKLTRNRVAWQSTRVDNEHGDVEHQLQVVDLREWRIERRGYGKTYRGSIADANDLVLTRTGAIAWIQPGSPMSVRAADAEGRRVLYRGNDIDGDSLRRSGSTVSWIAGGSPMSATLR